MKDFLTVGVVGAGDISDIYLTNMIHRFSNLSVKSVTSTCDRPEPRKKEEM